MSDIVFFDEYEDDNTMKEIPKINSSLYLDKYNKQTTECYRIMRQNKLNVLTQDIFNFDITHTFAFKYMWDPYTGERNNNKDPYGPLYFHPDDLIYYFYINRLRNLWCDPVDEGAGGGYYEGYYDEGVGKGETSQINSRGLYNELYLFRLPILDCYLPIDHDQSLITMGPQLTITDLTTIDHIANKYHKTNYETQFESKRPSLVQMSTLYLTAINPDPYIKNSEEYNDDKLKELKLKENQRSVDLLKKM
jgi:hypothetical protein